MAVYVIVILAVVVMLVAAYRALGQGATPVVSTHGLLATVLADLRQSLTALPGDGTAVEQQSAAVPVTGGTGRHAADPGRDGRRRAAAVQQRLDGLAPATGLSDDEAATADLLRAAADDAAWAWRMVHAGSLGPGLSDAVAALRAHASQCCAEADRLLAGAVRPEPVDGP